MTWTLIDYVITCLLHSNPLFVLAMMDPQTIAKSWCFRADHDLLGEGSSVRTYFALLFHVCCLIIVSGTGVQCHSSNSGCVVRA
ncbi:hypothetical protein CY34DRAFT_804327 [Suillus luteus UH-Slu-Lm8-n1]|uniref:Uncharacterized protein n=1 Tax=Suillus luteus UH-Slu-Lm8-n1 TaxID=930992 RepID=A0A0D0B9N0_9AGAM|nr:hypothetical protein CY34DRAFT_804327 [Suillus luteus UH-Slu-Lm8-n1]